MSRIPLLLSVNEANALIDAWEALNHEQPITPSRYDTALKTIEWVRLSIGAVGRKPRYSIIERVRHELREKYLVTKLLFLQWHVKRTVYLVNLTREERVALLKFLILHKATGDLAPVMERLNRGGDECRTFRVRN